MRTIADLSRWAVILGIWGVVTYLLWGLAWFWAAIWVVPGFIVIMNVVGFATLPIYHLVGLSDPDVREAKRVLDDLASRRRDSD